jgi:hypothetical protein
MMMMMILRFILTFHDFAKEAKAIAKNKNILPYIGTYLILYLF